MIYLDIKTAEIICDLSEFCNFNRVAEKHKISPSAISRKILRLEKYYECQIINRKDHPLTFTKIGELFYSACKEILERNEEIKK